MSAKSTFIEDYVAPLVLSAIGAVSAIVLEKVVTKYGHTFIPSHINAQFGIKSIALIGAIGVIQNIASVFLSDWFDRNEKNGYTVKGMILGHLITAGTLVGLTALAAKTNLIVSGLTLTGGALLFVTSYIENQTLDYIFS